jgi:hypothetical protein
MLTLVRRFLVLAALVFWLGGFTFYGAVVIPVGLRTIGMPQTLVTGPVTHYLNVAGAVALVPFAWDIYRCRDRSRGRAVIRWITWAGMSATLAGLFGLHDLLLRQVDAGTTSADLSFRVAHEAYRWLGTGQCIFGVMFAGVTLAAWRGEDRDGLEVKRE